MRTVTMVILAASLAVTVAATSQDQTKQTNTTPAQAAKSGQKSGIQWTAGFDLAMKSMGVDTRPVILYFTFDT